jgi:hypothetical protein
MQIDIEYKDWHAIHDFMSKTLHVSGVCNVRGGGFAVTLEEHVEPLINPMMRTLDLVVFATAETPSRVPVEWREPWDDDGTQYTEVGFSVRGMEAGPPPTLQIEEVH